MSGMACISSGVGIMVSITREPPLAMISSAGGKILIPI